MKPIIYGIPTCDTVRKARKWLNAQGIEHEFVDLRATPPAEGKITEWLNTLGASTLVNKRSTTWKNLDSTQRTEAEAGNTVAVLLNHPTLIKRPVMEFDGGISVGFSSDDYSARFS